jgi:uncharacterized membrane protein YuzA (DUF378 family)
MLKKLDLVAAAVGIFGGANWLAIATGKVDLIGRLTGKRKFGETNLASRTLYGIIGGSALWSLSRLLQRAASA